MKKALCITILALLCLLPMHQKVSAMCQSSDSNYGAVTLQAPALATTGSYNIWTRIKVPNSVSTQYRLEVNDNVCYLVGGSSIAPNQWQWVSFQDGDLSRKVSYDFERLNGNSLKLIGIDPGVKIDRILLVKNDCIPTNLGNNCQSDTIPVFTNTSGAVEVPPPSNQTVNGFIVPSSTISQNAGFITKVVYNVDAVQVPTAKNFSLDTTLLSNGSHRIAMQITKVDGIVSNEVTTLNVNNKQNALSPITRWARLHKDTAVLMSSSAGIIFAAASILLVIRHIRLNKRLLEFHGF